MSILAGASPLPTEESYEYSDPEGWEPMLAARSAAGQHARSSPDELKYVVHFKFSKDEYRKASTDAVLLDSPVFDDITITYMRRPKILQWRDMSE